MTPELVIILFSLLVFISILLYNPARTYGIPAMLIFIGVGVGLGNGGFDGFTYDYPQFTDTISSLALNLIIFSGGLHTNIERIKPVLVEGLILSTVGVLLTAAILGYFIFLVTGLSLLGAILMGAIVSSTDAAAVFSILESKQLRLKENTDATLELESGTNDPMAIVLVLGLTLLILNPATETSYLLLFFFKQLGVGSLVGIAFGLLAARLLATVRISEKGLVPIFVLACVLIATLGSELLGGNRLIASYLIGITLGNKTFSGKENTLLFFNSTSWLSQVTMFILLGLQVFPQEMVKYLTVSLLPAVFLILCARPLSVFICMLFNKSSMRKKLFVSWVGLKGATPIVFAFIPVLQGVDKADAIFNVVFFVVLISILVQGTTIGVLARWLKLEAKE